MNPENRIQELEAQVARLTSAVQRLLAERTAPPSVAPAPSPAAAPRPKKDTRFVHEMKSRVDRVIRQDGESIETYIGAVWLSRAAVVALMTALALAARETYLSNVIGAHEKVAIGYAISALFSGYGFFYRKRRDLFSQAILGCGLATLYFTTYAVFFVAPMRLFDLPRVGIGLVLACLIPLALVAHLWRSQTVAGIGFFLAYYSVVVSCTQSPTLESLVHALLTATLLALVTLVFHYAHRWLLFSWGALIATHLTYIKFFFWKPPELDMGPETYFWLSNGFLTVCYLAFSIVCIVDGQKTGEYRRTVAPLAGVNSFVYFTLTWFAIRDQYPAQEWMFRSGFAAALLIFAVFAETSGPKRNYLFQIFVAKTVIMLTLALQAYLSGEKLLVAMAIECLGLGFSYKRSGMVVFKVLGLGLMVITTAGFLLRVKLAELIPLGDYMVPANWFSAVGIAAMFCIVAWFYERFVKRLRPEQRSYSGHWFLADSVLDWSSASLAMAHAAAAVLTLLTITIVECGEDPLLPFLLAGEGATLAVLGLLLRTPQIEVACVLLLVAAHVCFHIFLWLPMPDFTQQEYFEGLTIFLACLTYVGAHGWERYLRRFQTLSKDIEHHVIAAIPYLLATFLLTTLLGSRLSDLQVPAALGTLGVLLLFGGWATGYTGVTTSGLFAVGMGAARFYLAVYNIEGSISRLPGFPLWLALFLGTCAVAERMLYLLERLQRGNTQMESYLRTLMVALLVILGGLGLYEFSLSEWSPPGRFILYLLGLATCCLAIGVITRERRYRWSGILLLVVVIARAFLQFREASALIFAATALVLLAVSWGYSRRRRDSGRSETEGGSPIPAPASAAKKAK